MARTNYTSVDQYMASLPAGTQAVLQQVRRAIRKALPTAAEGISYQIPVYTIDRRAVIYFAGWTHHYSLYPASAGLVARFAEDLAPYAVQKGTIRFPLAQRVPTRLIAAMAKFRASEAVEGVRVKVVSRRP